MKTPKTLTALVALALLAAPLASAADVDRTVTLSLSDADVTGPVDVYVNGRLAAANLSDGAAFVLDDGYGATAQVTLVRSGAGLGNGVLASTSFPTTKAGDVTLSLEGAGLMYNLYVDRATPGE